MTRERYGRLLGYPDGELADGRVTELAAESRAWFAANARPWAFAAPLGRIEVSGSAVVVENGWTFESARLAARLSDIDADRLVVAVVSAGTEVDSASAAHWAEQRPDEGYFLDRFGAAAAIQLGGWAATYLRAQAADDELGLAPGYSPGYDGWDLGDQVKVAKSLIAATPGGLRSLPGALRILDSGMLEPKSSLLAVFGLTTSREAVEGQWARQPCSWCSLSGCSLRGTTSPVRAVGT